MSLTSIMNSASTGLIAAQTQLRVISDNVANVNTEGYVRKIADQTAITTQGMGAGVAIDRIRLATDRFLQAASLSAGSEAQRQGTRAELYDRVQSLFGDPSGDGGFFSQIDSLFSAFAAASESATSGPVRQDAMFKLQSVFDESTRISGQIQAVREDADGRIKSAIARANDLFQQIENLNVEISRSTIAGGDASGAESAQAGLIDELAGIMDIRVSVRPIGGVSIRTGTGLLLAGDGAATLSYARSGAVNAETLFDEVWITEPRGSKRSLQDHLQSGELKGLLEIRDVDAPGAAERLAELTTRVADELNRAHNASSAVPAPQTLTGRNTGLSAAEALRGFTGSTTFAITNAAGVIQAKADVVFSGGTMTVNGAPATTANFLSVLQTQLGGPTAASVGFNNGVLSIGAVNAANGVAIADNPASPSDKAGRGFSHFFGLNDLVSTDRPAIYETGLVSGSAHGFAAGQSLSFRMTGPSGSRLRDVPFTIPAGATTMAQLVTELNSPTTGVGAYGSFALEPVTGRLTFTPVAGSGNVLAVAKDTTTQTPSGVSFTELFGVGGGVRASRADGFRLRADIQASPSKLALAQLDTTAVVGGQGLASGDGRGALLLADAGARTSTFAAAGGSSGGQLSISRYAAELSGDIGGRAAAAADRRDAAETLYTEAKSRQQGQEGVNLDEELVKLTTYQQAFNASARLIQSAKDMYDVLLGML